MNSDEKFVIRKIKIDVKQGHIDVTVRGGDDDDANESLCQDKRISMNSDEKVGIRQITIDVNQGDIDVTVDRNAATNDRQEMQTILGRTAWSK